MKFTIDQLDAIAEKLRQMPPVERKNQEVSKQEAVKVLAKEIVALQKRGYTLEQISEALRGNGLDIATGTLKSYMQRAKPLKKVPMQVSKDTPRRGPALTTGAPTSKATFTPNTDSQEI